MNPALQVPFRTLARVGLSPPPPASMLATIAAAMASGSWAQVTGLSSNMSATFHISTDVESGSMCNDSYYWPWDPINKRIVVVGMDHYNVDGLGGPPGDTQRHCWFDDASGLFVVGTNDTLVMPVGTTPNHGFQHTAVNPYTGHVFHAPAYTHDTAHFQIWECNPSSGPTFVQKATVASAYAQVSVGCCWWTGSFTGRTLGAQGAYMLFNCGASQGIGTGEILIYDPTVPGWLTTLTGVTTSAYVTDYGAVMAYSAVKNCAVFGGGHSGNTAISFRLNSDGTTTRMPDCPSTHGIGAHCGSLAADPVGGNFLLFNDIEVWELNPTGSGTWTQMTGGRAMPAGMQGNYSEPPAAQSGGAPCTIPDYGVIAHVIQQNASANAFWLYKH